MRSVIVPALVALLVVLGAPGAASAQDLAGPTSPPSEAQIAEARGLYQAGNAAADEGRFDDALPLFVRAFSLSGNPAALYNAARTLRSLGRHVQSRAAFERLLTGDFALSEATRAEASALRDEEAARIAELALDDLPAASPDLVLHVDGTFRPDGGERPLHLALDAGEHGLSIELAGHAPFRWQGVLAEGARERVSVSFAPLAPARSIVEEPLFWISIGVAVVTAAVLGGYFGWDAQQLRPEGPTVVHP